MEHTKKDWNEIKSNDSWAVFKIMSEFVEGYDRMAKIGPCVSIFGSARTKEDNKYYQLTVDIAEKIARLGYGVISGGGPGIMQAANKGAQLGKGASVGLNIDLPFEQNHNPYIDQEHNLEFDYFFVRKVIFVKYSQAFVVLPGGFGTLDENSLNTALDILSLLQHDGKLIGIISHINTLKDRIDLQIKVEPNGNGVSKLSGVGVQKLG